MQWFRMYAEFATDPKVQMMSEAYQRRLVLLFCMRCGNGDVTLQDGHIAWTLRVTDTEWQETKKDFIKLGIIDDANRILKWDRRQYVSDSSVSRVSRYRQKRRERGLVSQESIPKKIREAILKPNSVCCYCNSSNDLTIDHKTPTCRGGETVIANLQIACRTCNADKRNMTHEEYIAWPGRVTFQKRPQITEQIQNTTEETQNPFTLSNNVAIAQQDIVEQLPLNDGTEYFIMPKEFGEWQRLYPAIDLSQELRSIRGWLIANPTKRKTRSGILRFVNAWLSKAQNNAGVKPNATNRPIHSAGARKEALRQERERAEKLDQGRTFGPSRNDTAGNHRGGDEQVRGFPANTAASQPATSVPNSGNNDEILSQVAGIARPMR